MAESTPRLVILGTGFGAFNLVKNLNRRYLITTISPRNHFLFTPLLASTTVGTIEFRSIIEPIRYARNDMQFYHARAAELDPDARTIACVGVEAGDRFTVAFDYLVIATGAVSNTFNIPGVAEHALFLKELNDARELRQKIIRCFERAALPGLSVSERQRLVHFIVCGGGPTGVEFAAELNDFIQDDLRKLFPHLIPEVSITLVEATTEILSTFDEKLRKYATERFRRQRINVLTNSPVVRVDEKSIHLRDGSALSYGLLLWSTGNGPTEFVKNVPLPRDPKNRLIIDRFFRVRGHTSIYALGDCSVIDEQPLAATSQVAQQQGKYLARALNNLSTGKQVEPFTYRHLGMLAYVGGDRALADLDPIKGRGWATWLFWRSAYLSRIVSLKNKTLVLFDWVKTTIFGRDVSQF
jgi:NADH:ubiquinone reductase (non-electrogenic)